MNENGKVKEHVRTVSQIFIDGIHVSEYSDLQSIARNILNKEIGL